MVTTLTATDTHDWKQLYHDTQTAASIPNPAAQNHNVYQWTVRDMYVDLAEVATQMQAEGKPIHTVIIIADTLNIPDQFSMTLDAQNLIIIARQLVVGSAALITAEYTRQPTATMLLCAQLVYGTLTIRGQQDESTLTEYAVSAMPDDSIGWVFALRDGHFMQTPRSALGGSLNNTDSDLVQLLQSTFLYASVLYPDEPTIAANMLRWLIACTGDTDDLRELRLQSASLLIFVQTAANGIAFVPALNPRLYKDEADAFLNAAQAAEQQYERFSDKEQDFQLRVQAAQDMLAHCQDTLQYLESTMKQAATNLLNAQKARAEAVQAVSSQLDELKIVQIDYAGAVKEWQREQTVKAALQITLAVFDFLIAIGGAIVSFGALSGGAASSAEKVGSAAGNAADTAETERAASEAVQNAENATDNVGTNVERAEAVISGTTSGAESTSNAVETAKKAADSGAKLKNIMDAIVKQFTMIKSLNGLVNQIIDTEHKDKSSEKPTTTGDKLTTLATAKDGDQSFLLQSAKWDEFQLEVDQLMGGIVTMGVPKAADFQLQLKLVGVYSKALIDAQVAVLTRQQEYDTLSRQRRIAQNDIQRLSNQIKVLVSADQLSLAQQNRFFALMLASKISLFTRIVYHHAAFTYWAMRMPRVRSQLVQPVAVLRQQFARLEQDYNEVLTSFSPPPQEFSKIEVAFTRPLLLETLVQGKPITVTIDPTEAAFSGFDRVRVNTVRVWLRGVRPADHYAYIRLTSSGSYADRFRGQVQSFITNPIERVFQYHLGTGAVRVDGQVADEQRYAYFEPSPFTSWTISLPAANNVGLDLSGLHAIVLEFSGSLIASMGV